jgi:ATP-dependent protease HslVU (ClpYQ) peptidase subunit
MTTIITDGVTMVADSMLATDDLIDKRDVQKVFRIGKSLVGIAGEYSRCLQVIDYLNQFEGDRDKFLLPDNSNISGLILKPKKQVLIFETDLYPFLVHHINAIGSGASLAIGAMYAGATPMEALKIVVKLDPFTGGKLREYKL